MAEVLIIALVVIILAIAIGKANHSDALIWRLLFVFSLSTCVTVSLLYILNSKPKASAQTIEKTSKMIVDVDSSHTVKFVPLTMVQTSQDTVGKDTTSVNHFHLLQFTNVLPATTLLGAIAEHIIFDSS